MSHSAQRWKDYDFATGAYPKTAENSASDRAFLREIGFPEDFAPTPDEQYMLVTSYLDDGFGSAPPAAAAEEQA